MRANERSSRDRTQSTQQADTSSSSKGSCGKTSCGAAPFSLDLLELTGPSFRIAAGAIYPSVSDDNTLAYLDLYGSEERLVWLDRRGGKLGEIGSPQRDIKDPSLAPNGTRVAAIGYEDEAYEVWVHETARPVKTRLTFNERWPQNPRLESCGRPYRLQVRNRNRERR